MSEDNSRLISISQFKKYTRLKSETVDQDIECGIIKTETNKKGNPNVRWYGASKNLSDYRKAKDKWEREQQFSAAKAEPKPVVKTKIVKVGDMLKISRWSKEANLKSPTFLTAAIADDKLFELTNVRIRDRGVTGTRRRHFEMEWLGPEKAAIIVDVLYMKKSPIEWRRKFLAEKLNDPVEEVEEEIPAEEPEEEVTPDPQEVLVEAVAQFLFSVKKRFTELVKEDADVQQEAT